MAYVALYRKWRPQGFDSLVGQEAVRTALTNALETGRIAHAYLPHLLICLPGRAEQAKPVRQKFWPRLLTANTGRRLTPAINARTACA